ncbi:hypoxanthine phosphoribosyltransferase [Rhodocaloribacter litoris]|uniref:hypoxanthine phosphoribosyltransferase n=1 Tax=Rhodocaloribacter litoris TaxID=2558931 RepID=UPI001420BF8E|nr:hypoxanthine phosphoribosyltransferase [Rhodocaloribacter litoris]QXD15712.1 hypoxanthine phosphoribosyltransferase [Rhodocaloribacter litoris]GIV60212.1 MAG: hypoxanthine phosphoribosyltransferase [Rhodothermaceae bacterium]
MSSNLAETKKTILCRGERFRLYLDRDTIQQRVRALGEAISRDYEGKRPILIGVLNGAFMFLADLMRAIDIDCEVDFLKLSSYGASKISSGVVHELKKIDADLAGRHVLIVEDIVDTGLSMAFIIRKVQEEGPASVRTVTLLHKEEATRDEVPLDYVGFRIPNLFVIGYGLDYGQLGRNLPDLYILDDAA